MVDNQLTFEEKTHLIKEKFQSCSTQQETYAKVIELGRTLPPFSAEHKTENNRVQGCQSLMYLHAKKEGDKVFFEATSDALISAGLAFLLISVYSGETPETIIRTPPLYLKELGISTSLSPNRANGLASLLLQMQRRAAELLTA